MTSFNLIPFVGRTFEVDFGDAVFHTTFDSEHELTFIPIKGNLGIIETVQYDKRDLHPNAYMLFWQEKDTTTVTGYWDFEKMIVYSYITLPGNKFLNLRGKLTPVSNQSPGA